MPDRAAFPLGQEMLTGDSREFDLLFTHCHYDHIEGLPFFRPLHSRNWTGRIWSGHLAGRMTTAEMITPICASRSFRWGRAAFPPTWFNDFAAGDAIAAGDGVTIRTVGLNHPGGSTATASNIAADRSVSSPIPNMCRASPTRPSCRSLPGPMPWSTIRPTATRSSRTIWATAIRPGRRGRGCAMPPASTSSLRSIISPKRPMHRWSRSSGAAPGAPQQPPGPRGHGHRPRQEDGLTCLIMGTRERRDRPAPGHGLVAGRQAEQLFEELPCRLVVVEVMGENADRAGAAVTARSRTRAARRPASTAWG
jgi:hypothetical protein